ncbi:hypothetical protein BD626DRAFT_626027 [Schizophyllum amplum]|uniref:F-box domain-containing protein n=1 Tax=Schizophyllum amplum TaxID=97359 RepID=A0A550CS28_9AGAR|nr:hypothetical protein BD626DRAFT_626027 [Auriculariopsis ampla]
MSLRSSSRLKAQREQRAAAQAAAPPKPSKPAPKAKAKADKRPAKRLKVDVDGPATKSTRSPSPLSPLTPLPSDMESSRSSSPARAESPAAGSVTDPASPTSSDSFEPPRRPFETLPLELTTEIVKYCQARDLLHLSKVNVEFRDLLLAKRSREIWIQAFTSHVNPLPECPEKFMSAPQLAEVIWGNECRHCRGLVDHTGYRIWAFAAHVCEECYFKCYMEGPAFAQKWKSMVRDRDMRAAAYSISDRSIDPAYQIARNTEIAQKLCDSAADNEKLAKYEKKMHAHYAYKRRISEKFRLWMVKENDRIVDQRMEFILDKAREEFGEEDLEAVRKENRQWHADQVYGYDHDINEDEWDEVEDELFERFARYRNTGIFKSVGDLRGRLIVLEECCVQIAAKEGVEIPCMDLMFSKTIMNALVSQDEVGSYIDPGWHHSNVSDEICERICAGDDPVQVFRAVMNIVRPATAEKTGEYYATLRDEVLRLPVIEEWETIKAEYDEQLVSLLPEPASVNDLQLAATIFQCAWCAKAVAYPAILMHNCLRIAHGEIEDDPYDPYKWAHEQVEAGRDVWDALMAHHLRDMGLARWNDEGRYIGYHAPAHDCACRIVKACGQDTKSATAAEMDALKTQFVCTVRGCSHAKDKTTMGWRELLQHCVQKHRTGGVVDGVVGGTWAKLGEESGTPGDAKGRGKRSAPDVSESDASPSKRRKTTKV